MTFAPDVVFGGLTALSTPGDLGDKALAGGSDAILSSLGGIGLTAAIGPKRLGNIEFCLTLQAVQPLALQVWQ